MKEKGLLRFALYPLLLAPMILASFWEEIFEREIDSIPVDWHGSYHLFDDDPLLDDPDFRHVYHSGITISSEGIRLFDKDLKPGEIRVCRLSSANNTVQFIYENSSHKIELRRVPGGKIFFQEMAYGPTSPDSDGWILLETFTTKKTT